MGIPDNASRNRIIRMPIVNSNQIKNPVNTKSGIKNTSFLFIGVRVDTNFRDRITAMMTKAAGIAAWASQTGNHPPIFSGLSY